MIKGVDLQSKSRGGGAMYHIMFLQTVHTQLVNIDFCSNESNAMIKSWLPKRVLIIGCSTEKFLSK